MTRKLEFGQRSALSGRTTSAVIFVHGYGADGADLLGMADPLAPHLPDTVFLAPNAPDRCPGSPFGFQWFPIPWLDGSSEPAAAEGLAASADDLNGFLDQVSEEHALTFDKVALVGFSQGTMISLHVAPRRIEPLACVIGFSGRLLVPERLQAEAISKPPVLLVHGDQDQMVPPEDMPKAARALQAAGFEVYAHVSPGTAHGIAPDGLSLALGFLKDKLGV